MEFRLDFFFRIFMDTVFYAANILFYQVIFRQTTILAGWDSADILVFVSGYLFVDALIMTLVSNNLWWLPIFVNRGDLDFYLIRPVSSLFFLSFREFSFNSFINFLISVGILVFAIQSHPEPFTGGAILLFVLMLLLGTVLYYSIRMLSLIPVFWTISGRGMDMLIWQVSRFMERPDGIFSGWIRRILLSVIPFSVMASLPAHLILEGFSWGIILNIVLVTLAFLGILILSWNVALRAYSSASS